MSWSTDQLLDKTVEIFEPEDSQSVVGAVLFLHGYDGRTLRDNLVYAQELNRHRLACICPIGPQCWWTAQVCPSFDPQQSPVEFLAETVPDFCQSRWKLGTLQIGVTGIEMGGQGALQLVYRHARKFGAVAAISPIINFETWYGHGTTLDEMFPSREAARQATSILHIHPLDWPRRQLLLCDPADHYCIDGVTTLASKLSSSGVPFESDFESTHGGFGWKYADAMASTVIGFLAGAIR